MLNTNEIALDETELLHEGNTKKHNILTKGRTKLET
jgi:hypothetical protein